MLQSVSSVFVVYRRKTLMGSLDPTHANGMDKTLHNWWRTRARRPHSGPTVTATTSTTSRSTVSAHFYAKTERGNGNTRTENPK